jgi:hypothetical protein
MVIEISSHSYELIWASDVEFDGIRLEAWQVDGPLLLDISCRDDGALTLSTWVEEVAVELVEACIALARARR